MNAEMKKHYQEKGYVVVRNAASAAHLHDLYHLVTSVLSKHCPDLPSFKQRDPWSDTAFHEAMLRFRHEQPEEFGYLFDTVQTSIALWRLGSDKKLSEVAAFLMNDEENGLSVTDMLLRMDAPQDKRNKLEWHQDSSYFRQNDKGENGCVCSISLLDLTLSHGPLEVLPGSHSLGRIDVVSTGKTNAITSEQFRIPAEKIQSFTTQQVLLNAGDAIFFNFDLVHRSGFNSSGFFRFTAIARYHRMLASDFKAGRLVYKARSPVSNAETVHS